MHFAEVKGSELPERLRETATRAIAEIITGTSGPQDAIIVVSLIAHQIIDLSTLPEARVMVTKSLAQAMVATAERNATEGRA